MNSLLIGYVIGGLMLVSIAYFTINVSYDSADDVLLANTKIALGDISELIEFDLRKIGYTKFGLTGASAIIYADSVKIQFETDLENDGISNRITWHYDKSQPVPSTINPNDFTLYRTDYTYPALVKTDSVGMPTSVTMFEFSYYDVDNVLIPTPVADLDLIKTIEIKLMFESTEPINNTYQKIVWEKQINPRNLNH